MGLRIKTNVDSIIAQNRLSESRKEVGHSIERLASGLRINKSADDPAGLAVSDRIRAKISSMAVAKRNANDGISYMQVAEGSLNEMTNIMVRMRQIGTQAASDTLGNREREYLDQEFQQLKQEAARIVDTTEFNGRKVLQSDGNSSSMRIFVGSSNRSGEGDSESFASDVIEVNLDDLSNLNEAVNKITAGDLSVVPPDADGGGNDLGPEGTDAMFADLDGALNQIASYRSSLGAVQSRLNTAINNIEVTDENLNAANSRIRDVDFAAETAKFTQNKILESAGAAVLTHANSSPEVVLQMLRG